MRDVLQERHKHDRGADPKQTEFPGLRQAYSLPHPSGKGTQIVKLTHMTPAECRIKADEFERFARGASAHASAPG